MDNNESSLRKVIDVLPVGAHFWGLDADGALRFEGANAVADKILGIDHRVLVGLKIEEAFPALKEGDIPDIYKRLCRDGGRYERETTDYKDGLISGCFEIWAVQIKLNHMVVFFRDYTDKKRAEVALANERERLAVTLQSIGDGVIVTDENGRVTLMNSVAEQLTDWTTEDANGHPLLEVFHIINEKTRKICENPVDKVLKTGQIVGLANHTALISKSGIERIIADSGSPIRDSSGKILGVVLVFRDITNQSKIEEALVNTQRLDALGILAGGIAHDFNNLLSGLFGFISLAKGVIEKGDYEKAKEHIDRSLTVYERAKGLTRQLLTFSKGGLPVKVPTDLSQIIKDAVHFALSGSNVKAVIKVADVLPICDVDASQIEQVLDNILLNAVQAMPVGGTVTITARKCDSSISLPVELTLTDKCSDFVCICIKDEGIGIPAKYLSKIFDPFFTTKQLGSGLGLATAYSIIKKHEGVITVESEPEKGTLFHVYLPVSNTAKSDKPKPTQAVAGKGERVMIMDDEDFIRDIAFEILSELGFTPEAYTDGVAALTAFKESMASSKPFKFGILDLTIPGGMGGRETAAAIRKLVPDFTLIASSGYSEDPIMAAPKQYNFSGSLAKPYRREELLELLSALGL
ncbi:MAG: PAS domain S-box protein [Fibrobacteres bacterium]|nr:PAS domain S-box protein [Fibrobacterota bacterium]